MATRTEMVFQAARYMYHGILGPQVSSQLSEADAWKDADEYSKQEYVFLAWRAWQRLTHGVPELGTISVGACRCADNGIIGGPDKLQAKDRHCNTCGGRV